MDWGSTGDFLWHFLIIFAWIAYLLVLFQILGDLFRRDHKTSGWVKAIWVALLILFPWITALIYLIARGKGMAERAQDAAAGAKQEADDYIRQAAGRSPAQEIAGRQGAFGSRDHHPSRVRIAEGQIAQLATQNGRQDGFDQAEGTLLAYRKHARAKHYAAQLNAGSTPRSATDVVVREHGRSRRWFVGFTRLAGDESVDAVGAEAPVQRSGGGVCNAI